MKNQFTPHILLFFIVTILVIAGCIAFGVKKPTANKANNTNQPDLLTVAAPNLTTCPKVLQNINTDPNEPFYFSYLLETTEPNCVAQTVEDLFGESKLFGSCNDCTFVLEEHISEVNIKHYIQYYKGIEVQSMKFLISYANGKIHRTTGFYAPNLSIDTTGMLSKEEAVKKILAIANFDAKYKTQEAEDYLAKSTNMLIDPQKGNIFCRFHISKISPKPGDYYLNMLTGTLLYYFPSTSSYLTDCFECNGNLTNAISCQDTCSTTDCTLFADSIAINVPTIYNDCQSIYVDECVNDTKTIYRLSPKKTTLADSINVYDGSHFFDGFPGIIKEIDWCEDNGILSKGDAIGASLQYALSLSRNYFNFKNAKLSKRIRVLAHFPAAPGVFYGNESSYYPIDSTYSVGDGDSITFNPLVSVDVVAHEYSHAALYHTFKIGSQVTHSTHPQCYQAAAIHEGVADIFSVLVRKHAFGSINWVIGDEVVIPTSTTLLPRDLAHPENTTPPQALYYNDPTANWDTTQSEIYNHAGIIAKWFYLITNGGTGYHYATDSLTVEPLTIDTAEMVLIGGLKYIGDTLKKEIPSFAEFAVAMSASAQTISCTAYKQTVRALKAVGLGLNLPGGKTNATTDDEGLCFIDLRLRDCFNDQGFEPNTECDDLLGWNDIWNSPDIWVCPQNDSCYLAASAPPEPAVSNRIGFTIYNAHPNLISDPAELHFYYTMASSGELWDFNWVDWYFTSGDYTCYIGDEIATSPVEIPAINPNDYFTGWTTWSPPNFVNPNLPFYADPLECWLSPEIDPLDGELKYEICLLARLLSEADPIRHEIYDNIAHNVIYNNNIVTKNLFFLNPGLGVGGGTPPAIAGNPSVMLIANNNATTANLNIVYQQLANGLGLQGANDSIEISLILSPTLWNNWVSTGQQSQGITLLTQREVRIDNYQTAKLLNIPFVAYERQPIAIKTTILTNGNKTTYWQNNLNNIEFKFSVFHEAATNTAINPSSNCMFVLKNYHPVNNSPRDAIQLICTPNPVTTGWGKLQMYVPQPVTVSIALFNLSGIKVQQILSNQHYQSGLHQIPFNITNLPNGMYICQLNTQTKTVATKIIKLTN